MAMAYFFRYIPMTLWVCCKKSKGRYSSSWEPCLRTMGRHLPYGITQCYLPPDTSERAQPNPGWYSIYLPRKDGSLSWPSWLDSAPAGSRTSDLSIMSMTPNRCTNAKCLPWFFFIQMSCACWSSTHAMCIHTHVRCVCTSEAANSVHSDTANSHHCANISHSGKWHCVDMNVSMKETHNVVGLLPVFCIQNLWVCCSHMLLHTQLSRHLMTIAWKCS